ncbi:hypothetical protein EDC04DRAFT_2605816 [Pisolithus marmoratus]|nr:hypothetical protein EDC04DRAFT_2605816 [Pisolithus marmoratus]
MQYVRGGSWYGPQGPDNQFSAYQGPYPPLRACLSDAIPGYYYCGTCAQPHLQFCQSPALCNSPHPDLTAGMAAGPSQQQTYLAPTQSTTPQDRDTPPEPESYLELLTHFLLKKFRQQKLDALNIIISDTVIVDAVFLQVPSGATLQSNVPDGFKMDLSADHAWNFMNLDHRFPLVKPVDSGDSFGNFGPLPNNSSHGRIPTSPPRSIYKLKSEPVVNSSPEVKALVINSANKGWPKAADYKLDVHAVLETAIEIYCAILLMGDLFPTKVVDI